MNRTIKEARVKRYHYDSHAQLTAHLHDFINAYNYGRRLKALHGLTPYVSFYVGISDTPALQVSRMQAIADLRG